MKVLPKAASYSKSFGEYLLPYDEVRLAENPSAEVLSFLQSTYEAGANLAQWNRAVLKRSTTA